MPLTNTVLALLSLVSAAVAGPQAAQTPPPPPAAVTAPVTAANPAAPKLPRWETNIQKFEAADRQSPPPQNAVLFIGSSSIVNWKTLARDFPDVPTINRGFGGSQIADSTRFVDRIVVPYRPLRIVFYAGDNDIAAGKSPESVLADFAAFVTKVRAGLPDVPIVFISIKPSISRWKMHETMEKANRLIRDWAALQKDVTYVDVWTPMLGADGKPRPELLGPDRLHMTPAGYVLWKSILTPYVR
jgi:lysophospholipase L1-like esterase